MVLIAKDSCKTIQNECPDEMCMDARSLSRLNRVYMARLCILGNSLISAFP